MIYNTPKGDVNINLGGHSYNELNTGVWKLGFISDNPGLIDSTNDEFYITVKNNKEHTHRCFKNKVKITLSDGSVVEKHIIHWVESEGWFCITDDIFWDQFTDLK